MSAIFKAENVFYTLLTYIPTGVISHAIIKATYVLQRFINHPNTALYLLLIKTNHIRPTSTAGVLTNIQ